MVLLQMMKMLPLSKDFKSQNLSHMLRQLYILGIFISLLFLWACTADISEKSGEELSKTYCGSCHLYPSPAGLDKATWEKTVLPEMGRRLGFQTSQKLHQQANPAEQEILKAANIYPKLPILKEEEWVKIKNFYLNKALDKIPPIERKTSFDSLQLFKTEAINLNIPGGPITSYIDYDTMTKNIWLGDGRNMLYELDAAGNKISERKSASSPIEVIRKNKEELFILNIGYFHPNDLPRGHLTKVSNGKNSKILEHLSRPVDVAFTDLDKDGTDEIIICGYGNQVGKLSLFKSNGDSYKEQVLKAVPGATKVEVLDFNKDGLDDLVVLFAQGDERISVFYNKGDLTFSEEVLQRFSPQMGSNYFEILDWDKDGDWDILYSSGDNADYSIIPKSYHGIRIFINDGSNQFTQQYQYSMYGTSKVIARDFDQDGDLDIAAIAFFAEYDLLPQESFVYLENTGAPFQFKAKILKNSTVGRWLVMNAADIDQDGDEDILLGSFTFSATKVNKTFQQYWNTKGPEALILRNQTNN